jgi:hypothetical protein
MKRLIYLSVIVFIVACEKKSIKMSGILYDKSLMSRLAKSEITLKNDSLFIINESDSINLNRVYVCGVIDTKNSIYGRYKDGKIFKGTIFREERHIKVKSENGDFLFEGFMDSVLYKQSFDLFVKMRALEFDALNSTKKHEYILQLLATEPLKIKLLNGVSSGFSTLPNDTKCFVVTDMSIFQELRLEIEFLDSAIKKNNPFVLRVSNRTLHYTGNRFNDQGMSRAAVGNMYDYANYDYDKNRKEVELYWYDKFTNEFVESSFGYVWYEDSEELLPFNFLSQREIGYKFFKPSWFAFFSIIESQVLKSSRKINIPDKTDEKTRYEEVEESPEVIMDEN